MLTSHDWFALKANKKSLNCQSLVDLFDIELGVFWDLRLPLKQPHISVNLQIYRFWKRILLLLRLLFLVMNSEIYSLLLHIFSRISMVWYINAQAIAYMYCSMFDGIRQPQQHRQPPDLAKYIHFAAKFEPITFSNSIWTSTFISNLKECTSFCSPFDSSISFAFAIFICWQYYRTKFSL